MWPVEIAVEGFEGVVLRAPDPIDAAAIVDVVERSRAHLSRFLEWAAEPTTVDAQAVRLAVARAAFDAGGDGAYTLFEGDEVIGAVGVHRRAGPGALEVGYWLAAGAQWRGVMTGAVRAAIGVAFAVDDAERIVIHCHPDNVRSAAIPRRLGFTLVEIDDRPRMVWELRRPSAAGD